MSYLRLLLVATLVLTSACIKQTTIRSNPAYSGILKPRATVAFLPAQAEINTVGIGSKTRMYDYEANFEDVINREVPALLRENGYDVKIYRKADVHKADLSRNVLRLRSRYDQEMKKLYTPILMKEENAFNTTYNLGEPAKDLSTATGTDLFVLVDYSGVQKTNESRALGFAMDVLLNSNNSANVDGASMMISFIDAKTGNFLWSNIISDQKNIYGSAFDNMSSQEEVDIKRVKGMASGVIGALAGKLSTPPK